MCRKIIFATFLLGFVFFFGVVEMAYANDEITVTINGVPVNFPDQAPVIVGGRTLVPVRGVFEELGWRVDWFEDRLTARLQKDGNIIQIIVGSDAFGLLSPDSNGHYAIILLDVPAQIINGRTMLPIRAVLESVGYSVEWNEATQTISITSRGGERGTPCLGNLDFTHSITRTYGGNYQEQEPQIFLTYNDFNQYLDENWAFTGGSSGGVPHPHYSERLRLTEDFFESHFIVIFVIVEGSGQIRHRLDSVDCNGNINITRIPPGRTDDMAQWLVQIILSNEYIPEQFVLNMTTLEVD
jgi:hypothetical protein